MPHFDVAQGVAVLDKVVVSIPPARLRDYFRREVLMLNRTLGMPSRTFYRTVHLGTLGINALFHYVPRFVPNGSHKMEFIGASTMNHSLWAAALARIAEDPDSLRMAQVDFAADVVGLTVSWFRDHVWVEGKHLGREFLSARRSWRHGDLEGLAYGGRRNFIRIYDKITETMQRQRKLQRQHGEAAPSLEQMLGRPANVPLTRVERQCCGIHVPDVIRTFGQLVNAPLCRPFETLHFEHPVQSAGELQEGERLPQYAMRVVISQRIARDGLHNVRAWLNRHSANAWRNMQKYARPEEQEQFPDLQTIYLESLKEQLSA